MKIMQWPAQERPREKLLHQGAQALSDAELLAIFLRTGTQGINVVDLARQLLVDFGSLKRLLGASEQEFCLAKGLGQAKFVQLQAVLELARRFFKGEVTERRAFSSSADTMQFIASQLCHYQSEVFAILLLDSQHRFLHFQSVFYGTIDAAPVYPRVLVKLALDYNAAAVVLAHNHPSGVAEPSLADQRITQRIQQAMQLIDVRVLDHIVVGDGEQTSMAERGLI